MDTPSVRKAFIHFTLKEFSKQYPVIRREGFDGKKQKFGKEELNFASKSNDKMDYQKQTFQRYLYYDVPRLILINKRITKKDAYLKELELLHRMVKDNEIGCYFKNIYKKKKESFNHNSLCIIGRKLALGKELCRPHKITCTDYVGKEEIKCLIKKRGVREVITNILELKLRENLQHHKYAAIDILIKYQYGDKFRSFKKVVQKLGSLQNSQEIIYYYGYFKNLMEKRSKEDIINDDINNLNGDDISENQKNEAKQLVNELF